MERKKGSGGRKKWVSGDSKGVEKRGDGLGLGGPVGSGSPGGSAGGFGGKSGSPDPIHGSGGRGGITRGKAAGLSGLLIAVVVFLMNQGGGLLGGLSGMTGTGGQGGNQSVQVAGQENGGNSGVLDDQVSGEARAKRTVIRGGSQDTVTVMVYMCGTDLESRSGMGTADLNEMTAAKIGGRVNVIVYTGGCSRWQNRSVSNRVNQIYQVKDGGLVCLKEDAGDKSMTDPGTLTEFIRWCGENYPANRNELIFWDHGGGSVSGYGYDEKYPKSGSMTLAGIKQALSESGMTFDFIGFDACLMATLENALMLSDYADYMIASEETEPGLGWYYTDWLTALSENPSMPTVEIGKQIADDFVNTCIKAGQGQKTTLSVVDLAELEQTVPEPLAAFSRSTGELIRGGQYKTVSNARNNTREFARSSQIDQVDLIHLAENMGTEEGEKLAEALRGAVKYNLTSASMTNSYGISIYFPYKKVSSVDSMVRTYEQIGMDAEYTRCIREFASVEVGGQAAAGGSGSPLPALLGELTGGQSDGEALGQLFGSLMSGEFDFSGIAGLTGSNTGFLDNKALEGAADYLEANRLNAGLLVWTKGDDGRNRLTLPDDQWELVQQLELNFFYDDGEGYIDLGLDNVYEFDDGTEGGGGSLLGEHDGTWLAVDGQPVAYYFLDEARDGDDYTITGRVPAMLNGERVNLILVFDQDRPHGYIAGTQADYRDGETETIAKVLTELTPGNRLEFLCDYYSYDGQFQDNYYLGEPMTVKEDMVISNVDVSGGKLRATYRITDIYNVHYWMPPMEQGGAAER